MRNTIDLWRSENWNPARELSSLQRGIDRLFDEMHDVERQWKFNPACDVEESDSYYLVSFDLPGISKDDVKIELVDNQLTVSGERKAETKDRNSQHVVERFYGTFQRSFMLPVAVDAHKVEASYQDGVLRIAVPKAEAAKPKQIKISDGKGGIFGKLLRKDKEKTGEESSPTKVA